MCSEEQLCPIWGSSIKLGTGRDVWKPGRLAPLESLLSLDPGEIGLSVIQILICEEKKLEIQVQHKVVAGKSRRFGLEGMKVSSEVLCEKHACETKTTFDLQNSSKFPVSCPTGHTE